MKLLMKNVLFRVDFGGASRARTDDLVVANDALSQLSYSPTTEGDTLVSLSFNLGRGSGAWWASDKSVSPCRIEFIRPCHGYAHRSQRVQNLYT